jgi:hypothetical protein
MAAKAAATRCGRRTLHAAHGECEGRAECAVCHGVAWTSDTVEITEHRVHNGKRRHRHCQF